MDQLLLALVQTEHARDLARIAGNGGGVPCGHRVPHGERLHDRAEQADLQRGELAGPLLELLAPFVGLHARPDQVLEHKQHERGEAYGADAEPDVAVRDAAVSSAVANSDARTVRYTDLTLAQRRIPSVTR